MKIKDEIGWVFLVCLVLSLSFFMGRVWENYHLIHYVEDGRKFIYTEGWVKRYVLDETKSLHSLEKLPNGFYRCKYF